MFIIVGIKKNQKKVGVIDTQDMQVDWVSFTRLQEALNKGMQVQGLTPSGDILCQTEDVFNEIAEKLYATCAKVHLLHITQEQQIKQMFFNIAQPYGLAITPDDLFVSVAQAQIYFRICNRVCNFGDKNKVVTQAATQGLTFRKSINFYSAIRNMLDALKQIVISDARGNTDNTVYYIGQTPSNRLYKIIIGKFVYTVSCNVFCNYEYSKPYKTAKRAGKHPLMGCISSASPKSYASYLESLQDEFDANSTKCIDFIDKLTKKPIKADDVWHAYQELHKKYSTLQDIYVDI